MIKLVPFKQEHLDLIEFNLADTQIMPNQDLIPIFLSGPAYTLFKDDEIVGVATEDGYQSLHELSLIFLDQDKMLSTLAAILVNCVC